MRDGFDIISGLSGLVGGLVIGSIVMYINYRIGKKSRRFDERYKRIQADAKSFAWTMTIAAILIAWGIVIFIEGPKLAFFLFTFVYVSSMIAYLIGSILAERKN